MFNIKLNEFLERKFQLKTNLTTIKIELISGLTTFLAMAYILFVNPNILGVTGMDKGSVFIATCLAASLGSILMGVIANYPIALAPGMGLNAFFSYTVVLHMGYSWQIALGAVFLSAVIFFFLSVSKIRNLIIKSIPLPLHSSIAAGIGFFLAVIALQNAGIMVNNSATLISLGDLTQSGPLLSILGFIIIAVLKSYKVTGAILIGIITITLISNTINGNLFHDIKFALPSISPTFLQLDIKGALDISLISVILSFLFVDVFDNTGTLIGATRYLGQNNKKNHISGRMGKALIADSIAALFGSLLGTSTTTSYVESITGISTGGRTGLTAVTVGFLFLLSLFLAPLAIGIPPYATAPALLFVAILMIPNLMEIDWKDITTAAPVTITIITMPLTYSIVNGITFGLITWILIKLLSSKFHDLNITLIILSILFLLKIFLV